MSGLNNDGTILLSIIIPTYNEAPVLRKTLACITQHAGPDISYEVIIADGGSRDKTPDCAAGAAIKVVHCGKGRAMQMNAGARHASGKLLYFLHADTEPPRLFGQIIDHHYRQGFQAGCFRLRFDHSHPVLRFSAWASRFNAPHFQFGDQSLFVTKALFLAVGGFNEQLLLMEDVDLVNRLKKKAPFVVMPESVMTGARKYLKYGVVKTETTHLMVWLMYLLKMRQQTIATVYRRLLR